MEQATRPPTTGGLTEALRQPACIVDDDGIIVAVNAAWRDVGDRSATSPDAIGPGVDYLAVCRAGMAAGDHTAEAAYHTLQHVLRGDGDHATAIYPCPTPDELRWYRMTTLRTSDGEVLVLHADITDEIGPYGPAGGTGSTFVSRTIHELATPTTVVAGMLETLLDRPLEPALHEAQLRVALRQARRLTRLVEGLRELSRGGHEVPHPADVGLDEALATALPDRDVDEVVLVGGEARVRIDPDHFSRILQNLLSNARKYGRPPFVVEAETRGRRVRVRVSDHGEGVPEEIHDTLFEAFRRGARHEASETTGLGLGLTIVRDLVELSGGAVRLVDAPGGATFELDLPAAEATTG